MQRQEMKTVNATLISAQQGTNLIERDFSPGDFSLRELLEELKLIPPRKEESLMLEEFDPSY